MRTILFIIQKEFIQIFRNKSMLPIIFIVPLVQLLILVYAANLEMKDIKMYIVDQDMSPISRKLISKFEGSPFYKIKYRSFSSKDADERLKQGKVDMILNVPKDFEKKLVTENQAKVQLLINAINGTAGGLTNAYSTMIISDFNRSLIADKGSIAGMVIPENINISYLYWYNPELDYKTFMVPGILVLLVTIIGLILSGMNIVREKEIGTIEQINVTPIRKSQFIIGKLLPFWIIALTELAFGLTLGKILFNIPIVGNIGLIFFIASGYLLAILGLGLLISTLSNTQQQAMFISFFFMMIFILMSGLFTAVENMPVWAQYVNKLNPVAYFIKMIRMIMLKGSGFNDIKTDFFFLLCIGILLLSLAIRRYRKTA